MTARAIVLGLTMIGAGVLTASGFAQAPVSSVEEETWKEVALRCANQRVAVEYELAQSRIEARNLAIALKAARAIKPEEKESKSKTP